MMLDRTLEASRSQTPASEWAAGEPVTPPSSPSPPIDAFGSPLERKLLVDRLSTELTAQPSSPREAERIGHFVVLRTIGRGGMGVVFLAYDEALERKVAIKLLQTHQLSERGHQRFIREAQGLARLSHPNVVQIYEIGEHEQASFIAMEYVPGQTLGRWLEEEPELEQILEVFDQAGRGLAEAHAAGLVHRDFKPDNVLVGDKGSVKVTDFGLVRPLSDLGAGDEVETVDPRALEEASLTATGAVLGTPAYMSPEQLSARGCDARSDQFSFCVALWQAIYNERPYPASNIRELAKALEAGPPEAPTDERVPARIARALRRGLAADPADRWPDLDALLAALREPPRSSRQRWSLAAGLVVALSGSALWAASRPEAPPVVELCPAADAQLEGVWDEALRVELDERLQARGPSFAALRETVLDNLDDQREDWLSMHRDACEATHLRHEQSAERLDLRMDCLDQRRLELGAMVGALLGDEDTALDKAGNIVAELSPIAACGDPNYLASVASPPPPELEAEVARLREARIGARVRGLAGYEGSLEHLRELLGEAEATGYAPLVAKLLVDVGDIEAMSGEVETARELLERGIATAIDTNQDALAGRASAELIYLIGVRLSQPEEGLRWLELSRAWLRRGGADDFAMARSLISEQLVHVQSGQTERTEADLREALRLIGISPEFEGLDQFDAREAIHGGMALLMLARQLRSEGRMPEALRCAQAAAELRARAIAPNNSSHDYDRMVLAGYNFDVGNWPEAERAYELLAQKAERPDYRYFPVINLVFLSLARAEQIGYEAERELLEPRLARLTRLVDELEPAFRERYALSIAIVNAWTERLRGEPGRGAALLQPALAAAYAAATESTSTYMPGVAETELGLILLALGQPEQALAHLERSAEHLAKLPRFDPLLQGTLDSARGQVLLALERPEQAREALEGALELWERMQPEGNPYSPSTLDLLARVAPSKAADYRARAQAIRAAIEPSVAAHGQRAQAPQ